LTSSERRRNPEHGGEKERVLRTKQESTAKSTERKPKTPKSVSCGDSTREQEIQGKRKDL